MIGNRIGDKNIPEAKLYLREILKFSLVVFIIYFSLIWYFQAEIFGLFTKSEILLKMNDGIFWSAWL